MHIYATLIGTDFQVSSEPLFNDDGLQVDYITENDELFLRNKQYYDQRTGFLNTQFTPALDNSVLRNFSWYVNYMHLNYTLLSAYMAEKPGQQLSSMNLLNIGYIPVGYAPSFLSNVNPFIVQLLELRKVPYVLYRATVMCKTYFKTDMKDVWVSKLDAAKYLGCDPNEVTFYKLFGGLIHG